VYQRIIAALMRVEFVSERISYILVRGTWCEVIVMNPHVSTEEKVMTQRTVFMRD
jgi:hypothetical protein